MEGPTGAPSWLNVSAVLGLCGFIASLLVLWLGVHQLARATRGDLKGAAKSSGVAIIGLLWIAIGLGGAVLTIAASTVSYLVKT